jgi:hypothetical protein
VLVAYHQRFVANWRQQAAATQILGQKHSNKSSNKKAGTKPAFRDGTLRSQLNRASVLRSDQMLRVGDLN